VRPNVSLQLASARSKEAITVEWPEECSDVQIGEPLGQPIACS
jgi:hypothetical protein